MLFLSNIIPRGTTKNALQRETLKNTIDKSIWNSKECSNNPQECNKKKTEIKTEL